MRRIRDGSNDGTLTALCLTIASRFDARHSGDLGQDDEAGGGPGQSSDFVRVNKPRVWAVILCVRPSPRAVCLQRPGEALRSFDCSLALLFYAFR